MTDHPDFEALSAYHDGEAPELSDHVLACEPCRAEVARMGTVAAAIREPVGESSISAEEAIRRATDPAPPAARSRRNGVVWGAAASIAAVMALILGTATLLGDQDGDRPTTDQALTESVTTPPPGTETDAAAGLSTAEPNDIDGALVAGELGAVDNVDILASQALLALQATGRLDQPAAAAPPAATGRRRVVGTRPCEYEARALDPALDDVVYVATATLDGRPVVVLAFTRRAEAQDPQAPPPVTLTVMAQEGCAQVLSRPL